MSGVIGPSNSAKYEIRDSPGKGKGIFATRKFNAGDLVVDEEALIVVDDEDPDREIIDRYNALSNVDRIRFNNLACAAEVDEIKTLAEELGDEQDLLAGKTIAIFDTNCMAQRDLKGKTRYLGIESSRANHSCAPNTSYHFQSSNSRVQLRALHSIPAGAEITVSYVSPLGGKEWRASRLLGWGFTCCCERCTSEWELVSHDLLEQLLDNADNLHDIRLEAKKEFQDPNKFDATEQMRLCDFFVENLGEIPQVYAAVIRRLEVYLPLLVANKLLETSAAIKWFHKGYRLGLICRGPEDEFVKYCKETSKKKKYSLDPMSQATSAIYNTD